MFSLLLKDLNFFILIQENSADPDQTALKSDQGLDYLQFCLYMYLFEALFHGKFLCSKFRVIRVSDSSVRKFKKISVKGLTISKALTCMKIYLCKQ